MPTIFSLILGLLALTPQIKTHAQHINPTEERVQTELAPHDIEKPFFKTCGTDHGTQGRRAQVDDCKKKNPDKYIYVDSQGGWNLLSVNTDGNIMFFNPKNLDFKKVSGHQSLKGTFMNLPYAMKLWKEASSIDKVKANPEQILKIRAAKIALSMDDCRLMSGCTPPPKPNGQCCAPSFGNLPVCREGSGYCVNTQITNTCALNADQC